MNTVIEVPAHIAEKGLEKEWYVYCHAMEQLHAEIARLRAALEPFAKAAAIFDVWGKYADHYPLTLEHGEGGSDNYQCTVGDLRKARKALVDNPGTNRPFEPNDKVQKPKRVEGWRYAKRQTKNSGV